MTKILLFEDQNATIKVAFKVNLINATDDNFTVMQVDGLDDAEVTLGFSFRQLPYTVATFKAFALAKDLKLSLVSDSGTTVVQDFTNIYYGALGLGVDNI